jgi:predicted amidohydrolase
MNIGFVQYEPVFLDLDATLEKLDRLIDDAAATDLLVLPELCGTGYNFASSEEARSMAEPMTDSRLLAFLREKCRQKNLFIVAGYNERDGDLLYNSAALISPEGIAGNYRKMHLFMNEKDIFEPGNAGLPIFNCGPAKIGILICFDWQFPEVWRILALKGADIICHPSNLVLPGLCQRAVPLHALLNRFFVITANRTGSEKDLTFTGKSIIVDPKGNLLDQGPASDEYSAIVSIDLEVARNKGVTARNDLIADRRPDQYGEIINT